MPRIHVHPVTQENFREGIGLRVDAMQEHLVASTLQSLVEAKVNPHLFPLALYDGKCVGYQTPPLPMRGFTMYGIVAGVGFIQRLIIDHRYQGQGSGKTAMQEVRRRLRLIPEVRLIATSHRKTGRSDDVCDFCASQTGSGATCASGTRYGAARTNSL